MAKDDGLAEIIKRGGIHRNIPGTTPEEVLTGLVGLLPLLPSTPADTLLQAILEREALMPTGIGRGIALPHPRNPVIPPEGEQFAVLAFLEKPVDWNALDGEKVDTLFLVVSTSAKQHLSTLAELSFLCRQEDFYTLLKEKKDFEELLAFIKEAEKRWK